jgi:hypothetical protein
MSLSDFLTRLGLLTLKSSKVEVNYHRPDTETQKDIEMLEARTHDFGQAIRYMKAGHRVARLGWNGKDMFLFLVPGSRFMVNRPPLLGIYEEGTEIQYQAHIDMKTAQGTVVPWLASQSDMLADDWIVLAGKSSDPDS